MEGTLLEDRPVPAAPRPPAGPARMMGLGAALAVLGFVVGAACFAWLGQRTGETTATEPSCSASVASASWAGEGARLIAVKAVKAPAGSGIANAGPWAYQSAPIDVTGNGTYVLDFTVPARFQPGGMAYNFPPGMDFEAQPTGPQTSTLIGTTKTLHVPVAITGFRQPCTAFSIWIS